MATTVPLRETELVRPAMDDPGDDNLVITPPPSAARTRTTLSPTSRAVSQPPVSDHLEDTLAPDARLELETAAELEAILSENLELRDRTARLEQQLNELNSTAKFWQEQHADQEKLLEQKSDLIRELHAKVQELQARPPVATPGEEELLALSEQLEQERRQLQEDEQIMTQQMREMEIQMSRERAELARQRIELQRLKDEIQHELETASRESALRERLQPIQRRHQEILHRKGGPSPRDPSPPQAPSAATPVPPEPAKESGLFRRLFGQGR